MTAPSHDTKEFEVRAELDDQGVIRPDCARRICKVIDEHGFVLVLDALDETEATTGKELLQRSLQDPNRERSTFASETDTKYGRRDFCPLPSTPEVVSFAALLCHRAQHALDEYCGRTRPVLEISTLTSYYGSSHQYIHRDPPGVLCMFAAVDHVSEEQGGTVFVPGTHPYNGAFMAHPTGYMQLYQDRCNLRILRQNLRALKRMRKDADAPISKQEYFDRVWSARTTDNHQPNLIRFLRRKNAVFDLSNLGPRSILRQLRHGKKAAEHYRLVQVAPPKGAVILYRSDVLHAGPDNRTERPRYFFNVNISRDVMHPDLWRAGYSAHSTLLENPLALGDLITFGASEARTPADAPAV